MSGTIKRKRNGSFTQISNDTLRCKDLSWKAKGLLCYLLSNSEDYEIRKSNLHSNATDGYDSTNTAFKELESKGYIRIIGNSRDKHGNFAGYDYEVDEKPIEVNSNGIDEKNVRLNETEPFGIYRHGGTVTDEPFRQTHDKEEQYKEYQIKNNLNINVDSKKSTANPKKQPNPAFAPMVEFFCKEYWTNYEFKGARDGKQINEIINQIERLFVKSGRVVTTESVVDFFKSVIRSLPKFYQYKNLTKINSGFSEIIEEIKNNKNGTKAESSIDKQKREAREFRDSLARGGASSTFTTSM